MNKKECNIILDLLPGYIENNVTDDTKEFIEEHLRECKNCREVLKNMKSDIINEKTKIEADSKIEIEKIKKVKRKFKTHKIILTVSSIIVLTIAIVLISNAIYNKFHKTLYDRILEAQEENKKLNNYYYSVVVKEKNYNIDDTFYWACDNYIKDGKFVNYGYWTTERNESLSKEEPKYIEYGEIGVAPYTKIETVNKEVITMNATHLGNLDNDGYYWNFEGFKNKDYKDVEIKTYENKEWYVSKTGDDKNYYEYWLNKDNLTDLRIIHSEDWQCTETIITIKKDVVTDENMEIKYDTSEYEQVKFPI